jgi:ABC-2 type transport system ATP-binding protein
MIEVERLTRRYGTVKAVDGITFAIGRGEIVGLLGLNGAGKTTTMRMLTTFLQATSGRAALAGHDVLDAPLEVRRKVGYLPENVPLYPEMRVREYLEFRARLKDVPRARRREAINHVVARCRLGDVEDRILGHLSKGYRQRVGLAEAMVHQPEILILDEPTAGLDPVQIREVRALIRELGDGHTILLSTHIMSEVEAVCGRVIIIERGKIAVDDTLENLRTGGAIVLEARGSAEAIRRALESAPGVARVKPAGQDGEYAAFEIQAADGADLREMLAARVVQAGWPLRRLDLRRTSLEERFIQAVSKQAVAIDADADAGPDAKANTDAAKPAALEAV